MRSKRKKKKGVRDYAAYLVLGGKGQGKTTLLMDMIEMYLKMFTYNRVFIHDPSNAFHEIKKVFTDIEELEAFIKSGKWKRGAIRFINEDVATTEKMHLLIARYLTDAFVVFDEWTEYIGQNPTDWRMKMLIKHRNARIEVAYVGHSLLDVPKKYVRGDKISKIILFKTGERNLTEKILAERYSCADVLYPAYKRVLAAPITDNFSQYYEVIKT